MTTQFVAKCAAIKTKQCVVFMPLMAIMDTINNTLPLKLFCKFSQLRDYRGNRSSVEVTLVLHNTGVHSAGQGSVK